jgi:predicted mannosyl-3-phosphoglycerate phosphatase (HAD superfamily)
MKLLYGDAGDRRVPVVALAVDEHAVAPNHQVVGLAAGDGCDDAALFARLARAIAVEQVRPGKPGEAGVLAGVVDGQT